MAALNPTSPIDTATLSRCKLTYFVGFTNDFLASASFQVTLEVERETRLGG